VSALMGWEGVRVAQDDIVWKPPAGEDNSYER
jgi:hypothetical protein